MSSGLELNKIAAAVLVAGIVAMVSGIIAEGLYESGQEPHGAEAKRGYTIAGAEEAAAGGNAGAAPASDQPVDIKTFFATADVAAGEAQLKKCTACHTFDKGGRNGVGPNQYGLVGADVAHKSDYSYSDALKALHGKQKWDAQFLSDFLANPKKAIPGNKMAFAGIKNPQDRANLIAYINTLSDSPAALPK